jgi:serine/threonine protein kinase
MLGIQLGRALEAAHSRGIVHRDVKPGNVLEAESGMWKLADFGIAHVPDSSLTITGQFIGSPAYAAPEGLLAGQFSAATDVYGIGATLYEALSGQAPYGESGKVDVAALARGDQPQPIKARCPNVPTDLARVVHAALSRDPRARPSAAQLAAELESASAPMALAAPAQPAAMPGLVVRASRALASLADAVRSRKRLPWVAGGVAAGMLLLLSLVLSSKDPKPTVSAPAPFAAMDPVGMPEQTERSPKQQKRWLNVQEKLAEGKLDEAAKELEKLLERDPGDVEARQILDSLHGVRRAHWDDD